MKQIESKRGSKICRSGTVDAQNTRRELQSRGEVELAGPGKPGPAKGTKKTPGSGRKKGTKNKIPGAVREMALGALMELGGQDYLVKQGQEEPRAFIGMLSKMIPTAIEGADGSNLPLVLIRDYRGKEGKD